MHARDMSRKSADPSFRAPIQMKPLPEDAECLEELYRLTRLKGAAVLRRAIWALLLQERRPAEMRGLKARLEALEARR